MSINSIKESIIRGVPTAVVGVKKVDKMGKNLLFAAFRKNIWIVRVYDESKGLDEIAEIRYNFNENSIYISSFNVSEEYQQNGIGRMIFEYALAHGDAMGANRVYGTASPTDPFKGISSKDESEYTYDKEVEALKTIYKKFGCRFIDDENFVKVWEPKSQIAKIDLEFKKMIDGQNIKIM